MTWPPTPGPTAPRGPSLARWRVGKVEPTSCRSPRRRGRDPYHRCQGRLPLLYSRSRLSYLCSHRNQPLPEALTPTPKVRVEPVRTAQHLFHFATETPPKTTNCRICQPFAGPHAKRARREPTQAQANTTDRTRTVLSAFPGMRAPLATSPSIAFGLPPEFLDWGKAGSWGRLSKNPSSTKVLFSHYCGLL